MYTISCNHLVSPYVYLPAQPISELVCIQTCLCAYYLVQPVKEFACVSTCAANHWVYINTISCNQLEVLCVYHLVQRIGGLVCMPSCTTSWWACMYTTLYNHSVSLSCATSQRARSILPCTTNHWACMYTMFSNQLVDLYVSHLVQPISGIACIDVYHFVKQISYCNIHRDLAYSARTRLFSHVLFQTTSF